MNGAGPRTQSDDIAPIFTNKGNSMELLFVLFWLSKSIFVLLVYTQLIILLLGTSEFAITYKSVIPIYYS